MCCPPAIGHPVRVLPRVLWIVSLAACGLQAHTGGMVECVCPLDGTKFEAWQDFSDTAFGTRLDLKRLGPIAQPWALAQCPKCRLPLFQREVEFSEQEKSKLRAIVGGKRFTEESKGVSAYFAYAVLREELKEDPFAIASTYLQASWEAEETGEPAYRKAVERAIRWFDLAADQLRVSAEKQNERQLAIYLPIELSRRIGEFGAARERLNASASLRESGIGWMNGALDLERQLINAGDQSCHDIGEVASRERSVAAPGLKTAVGTDQADTKPAPNSSTTALNSVEATLQNDGRQLASACAQYLLENGAKEVEFSVDPESGTVSGPIAEFVKSIAAGTKVIDGSYEPGGTFSLQNPGAFAGRAVVFDDSGRIIR